MKVNRIAKRMMLVGCLAAAVCVSKPVFAAGLDELGTVVDGSVLTDSLRVEDDSRSLLRGNYLSYGTSSLVNHEDGTVKVISTENVTIESVKEAIEDLGFDIVEE